MPVIAAKLPNMQIGPTASDPRYGFSLFGGIISSFINNLNSISLLFLWVGLRCSAENPVTRTACLLRISTWSVRWTVFALPEHLELHQAIHRVYQTLHCSRRLISRGSSMVNQHGCPKLHQNLSLPFAHRKLTKEKKSAEILSCFLWYCNFAQFWTKNFSPKVAVWVKTRRLHDSLF